MWSAHSTFFRDVTIGVTVEKKSFAHPLYYVRNRYHSDPAFREKLLARKRVKPENKKSMGRPHKYNLDENLNLVIIKKEYI